MRYVFVTMLVLGGWTSATLLNAEEPVTVSVYPTVAVARGTAQLKIFIERNDQNRSLNWEVDGPSYYRSSTATLEGAEAPRSWFFFVKDLQVGDYQVRATVRRSNSSEVMAQTTMTVIGGFQD